MTEQHDRDELVELMSRYANMADAKKWDELSRSHNQVNPRLDLLHSNKFRPIE